MLEAFLAGQTIKLRPQVQANTCKAFYTRKGMSGEPERAREAQKRGRKLTRAQGLYNKPKLTVTQV